MTKEDNLGDTNELYLLSIKQTVSFPRTAKWGRSFYRIKSQEQRRENKKARIGWSHTGNLVWNETAQG